MSQAKLSRPSKRQLGQFFTPPNIAAELIQRVSLRPDSRVLEPSFGTGSFVFAMVEAISRSHSRQSAVEWARSSLYGCEMDPEIHLDFVQAWSARGYGPMPAKLEHIDFFRWLPPSFNRQSALDPQMYRNGTLEYFDLIVGNPPFGGTLDPSIADALDRALGNRYGVKIKKETYAFFLVKCLDLLKVGGELCFICSDTLLTIPTMRGLRRCLHNQCEVDIDVVPGEFSSTRQNLIVIRLLKRRRRQAAIQVFGRKTSISDVEMTPNSSWRVDSEYARYFGGPALGQKFIASSGMTIGNNSLFLRKIEDDSIREPYDFFLEDEPITLARELSRARFGHLPPHRRRAVMDAEARGVTRKVVHWRRREVPLRVSIPSADYMYYNKATPDLLFSRPKWVIYWKDHGEYVYTYKRSGNWYLHGVGGKTYFGREGLTWNLIASRLRMRWLPSGYILDSGAPCAFLRPGVHGDELFFVLGWTLTDLCNRILKTVINHTRNIQSKDFERLPYPEWVQPQARDDAIGCVKELIETAKRGRCLSFDGAGVRGLNELYEWRSGVQPARTEVLRPLLPFNG